MIKYKKGSLLGVHKRFDVFGGSYCYWVRGEGPLVVLLHGWPVTSYHWRYLIPALNKSGYQTVAIDLKGLGDSSFVRGSLTKKVIAEEIISLLLSDFPKVKQYAVIGHDWGGAIAFAMAALDAKRIKSLIIEEEILPGVTATIPEPGSHRYPTWHGAFHREVGLAEGMIEGKESVYISYFLKLRAKPESLSKSVKDRYVAAYSKKGKTKIGLGYYRTRKEDFAFFKKLTQSKLKVPTLAIGGKFAIGAAVGQVAAGLTRSSSLIIMKNSGHYPAEEETGRFNNAVLTFLNGIEM